MLHLITKRSFREVKLAWAYCQEAGLRRPSVQRSIRLDPAQFDKLTQLAAAQQRSLADVLRIAIDHYLSGAKQIADTDLRHHRISEFSQIALDQIIRRDHPDLVEVIKDETNRRMQRHYGAR